MFTVLGPDTLLYTSCVLIKDHFCQLKHEIRFIFDHHDPELDVRDNGFREKIVNVVEFHTQLLR